MDGWRSERLGGHASVEGHMDASTKLLERESMNDYVGDRDALCAITTGGDVIEA